MDDPEDEIYEDDARALERELVAVVRRVLGEELARPEFRRELESKVEAALREVVSRQKRALREEARHLGSETYGRPAGDSRDRISLAEEGSGPAASPSRRGPRGGWNERREEGSWLPGGLRERSWIVWLLAGCLVLVTAGATWLAYDRFAGRGTSRSRAIENGSTSGDGGALKDRSSGPQDPGGSAADSARVESSETTQGSGSATSGADLDAVWLREIRAARATLPGGSPLSSESAEAQLECFFPRSTRERLDHRQRRLDGDLPGDFAPCVSERFALAKGTPNAAVFAAQALARKLLLSTDRSGLPWCPNADLGRVQPSQFKPDGSAGPTTFIVLNAVGACLEVEGLRFDGKSPAEAYLAFSYAALGALALAPQG